MLRSRRGTQESRHDRRLLRVQRPVPGRRREGRAPGRADHAAPGAARPLPWPRRHSHPPRSPSSHLTPPATTSEATGTGGWPTGDPRGGRGSPASDIGHLRRPCRSRQTRSPPSPPVGRADAPPPSPRGRAAGRRTSSDRSRDGPLRPGADRLRCLAAPVPRSIPTRPATDGLSLEERTPSATPLREAAARWSEPGRVPGHRGGAGRIPGGRPGGRGDAPRPRASTHSTPDDTRRRRCARLSADAPGPSPWVRARFAVSSARRPQTTSAEPASAPAQPPARAPRAGDERPLARRPAPRDPRDRGVVEGRGDRQPSCAGREPAHADLDVGAVTERRLRGDPRPAGDLRAGRRPGHPRARSRVR